MNKNVKLDRFIGCLSRIRSAGSDLTISQLITFLSVDKDNDVLLSSIASDLNVSEAAVSRMLDKLSDGITGKKRERGLGLIYHTKARLSDDDRRTHKRLSGKGLEVLTSALDRLYPEDKINQ